jgi:site-specific recombinase XerD
MDVPNRARASQTTTADDREQAFLAFLRDHLADDGSSPVAMPGYRSHITAWLLWCHERQIRVSEATVVDIRHYRRLLATEGLDPRLVSHKLLVLRRLYHHAVKSGIAVENPALGVYPFHGC